MWQMTLTKLQGSTQYSIEYKAVGIKGEELYKIKEDLPIIAWLCGVIWLIPLSKLTTNWEFHVKYIIFCEVWVLHSIA